MTMSEPAPTAVGVTMLRMRTPDDLAAILSEEGITIHPTRTVPELLRETADRLQDGGAMLLTGSHHVVKEAIQFDFP